MARRRAAPRAPSRTAWARRTEARTLALAPQLLELARANTRRVASDLGFLAALAREVVQARGAELTLAYRQVVWVLPGFRRAGSGPAQKQVTELCVVFVVRRKQALPAEHPQHLPRWLVTYADHDGLRQPFALPTDVQEAQNYHGAVAHVASGLWAQRPSYAASDGSFAGLVQLSSAEGVQLCLMSAMHVFTPDPPLGMDLVPDGQALMPLDDAGQATGTTALASSLPYGGVLHGDESEDPPSFDVQLAAVAADGETELRRRAPLRGLNPARPWVGSLEDLLDLLGQPGEFRLLTPDNHPQQPPRGAIAMNLAAMPSSAEIPYQFAGPDGVVTRQVFQKEPLRFDRADETGPMAGDSGSPIVFVHPDASMTFVAMHIGGDGDGNSWALSAWRIFDLANWSAVPDGAQLSLVEP